MMSSRPSGSNPSSYDRLHPEIRRWIREEGWSELREVQDRAIRSVLDGENDIIISAATAAGKTEAAFLPVLTLCASRDEAGLSVLYVSPLKALINDQFRRLDLLCERMEIPVVRWHGDAPRAAKSRTLRSPLGVALITPESIEALLVRRPRDAERMFQAVDFIILDELHAFLQGARGLHLASLMRRIDHISRRRPRRIGLSATLGEFDLAKAWLRSERPDEIEVIEAKSDRPELKLQVKGYVEPPEGSGADELEQDGLPDALSAIADHLFANLRGSNNLVFAGSRRTVEALADRLRNRSEQQSVPEEFFPHHGSLSRDLREDLELQLKNGKLPTTAVATTTLELGIDLGSVKSVAQIGAPRSLASLRQRLGRSGRRRGVPAILRIYVREPYPAADADPLERLRLSTIRAVAAVRLLVEAFVEPAVADPSLLTVALHQTLSVIVEKGGARADKLFELLCAGPLAPISAADYAQLLRGAAAEGTDLIEQAPDGTLMLAHMGERLAFGKDFYAIFESDDEWRLVSSGRTLGTVPIANALGVGSLVGFAGRRWRVQAVDDVGKVLDVVPHPSGRLPKFDRLGSEQVHDRLSAEMLAVYQGRDLPAYLDAPALRLLSEGRAAFEEYELDRRRLIRSGRDTHLLLWRGTALNSVFAVMLASAGLDCEAHDIGVTLTDCSPDELSRLLAGIPECPPVEDLAAFVENLRVAKYDQYVPEALLRQMWTRRNADLAPQVTAALKEVQSALGSC
jgi:ATP-dependent helicase Lhr and Lhr-like helicase